MICCIILILGFSFLVIGFINRLPDYGKNILILTTMEIVKEFKKSFYEQRYVNLI